MRIIDADALLEIFEKSYDDIWWFAEKVEEAPTITPESLVKRGRWIDRGNGAWSCSMCNDIFTIPDDSHPIADFGLKFCPNCGAKMEENDALMED